LRASEKSEYKRAKQRRNGKPKSKNAPLLDKMDKMESTQPETMAEAKEMGRKGTCK